MAQDIKRRIVLEGEKEYNSALKEIQRNQKTLRTELKAASAELGKNATAQQKAELRAKSAAKQILEQEKAVKTCEEALAKVKEEYADNEDVIAKWEQKLNDARANLAQMKDGLYDLGDGFKQTKSDAELTTIATKQVADAIGKIGDVGGSVSNAIENVFFGMIDTIGSAVSAMWDLVTETAAKVNGWEDIAGYWNTDTQTIQQYARAVAASGNAFEDLNSAVSKLVLGGKGDKITEMLGISNVNYEDQWDYAMAVMDEMYKMRQRGENMTPIFEEIFGEKKSTKVMDLLNDWETIKGLLDTFNGDNGGYGLTSDALSSMAALHVQVNTVEEKWDALKAKFAKGLGTATGELLVNVEGSLDALNDFMNAKTPEEREKALENLRTNVEEFFKKVADILREGIAILNEVGHELQESDDPLTALIGDILVKLTGALEWLVYNANDVKAAFEIIFGAWLLAKLAAVAGKLSSILMQIETIKAFKGIELGGAAAEGAGRAAAEGAAGAAGAGATKTGLFAKIGAAAKSAWAGLGGAWSLVPAGVFALGTLPAYISDNIRIENELKRLEEAKQTAHEAAEKNGMEDSVAVEIVDDAVEAMGDTGRKNIIGQKIIGDLANVEEAGKQVVEKDEQSGEQVLSTRTRATLKYGELTGMQEYEGLDTAMSEAIDHLQSGKKAAQAAVDVVDELSDALDEIEEMRNAIRYHGYGYDEEGEDVGEGVVGLVDRIIDNPAIYDALSEETQRKVAEYLNPESGFGVGSNNRVVDAETMMNILFEDMEAAFYARVNKENPEPTQAQKDAAEAFWDLYRETGDLGDKRFDALEEQFEGADELFDKLMEAVGKLYDSAQGDEWRGIEDLPANWWMDAEAWMRTGSENNGITSGDLANFRSLPGSVAAAVKSGAAQGVSGIKVYLDGVEVGRLVAQYVSETIARDVIM